jgi:hypothetical protein
MSCSPLEVTKVSDQHIAYIFRTFSGLHGVISQNIVELFITPSVRTSNSTSFPVLEKSNATNEYRSRISCDVDLVI